MSINRREFMQSVALAGAGLALSRSAFAQAAAGSDEIAVAIIGAGAQGRVLLGDCLNIPGIRFKAVCDIWPFSQRYAKNTLKKFGQETNVYEDYREMLDKEKLDAAIVATPDFLHAEHTIACLKAGLHVYCEKEMAHTLEAARDMVVAARETGKLCQVGHQRRSNPVYLHALEMLEKDKICGRLTNCYGQWNRAVQPKLNWPERYEIPGEILTKYGFESMEHFRNWRWYRKYSSGPIADLGSHQIDIFSWFLHTDPSGLMAAGGADYYGDREWHEDVMATYEYKTREGSARAFYQVLNTNSYGSYFERFYGDKGTLTISESIKQCFYTPEPGYEAPEWMAGVEPVERDGMWVVPLGAAIAAKSPAGATAMEQFEQKTIHRWHLENFFEAVRANDKTKLHCTPEVAYETAVAVLNVIPALEGGKRIEFKPEDFKA